MPDAGVDRHVRAARAEDRDHARDLLPHAALHQHDRDAARRRPVGPLRQQRGTWSQLWPM